MIYTQLDFFILLQIIKDKNTTTWEIAKKYKWDDFKNPNTRKDVLKYYSRKSDRICKRLKVMSNEGFVNIEKINGSKNNYVVDSDKVVVKKIKFPDGYGNAIFILEKDKLWQVFQIYSR